MEWKTNKLAELLSLVSIANRYILVQGVNGALTIENSLKNVPVVKNLREQTIRLLYSDKDNAYEVKRYTHTVNIYEDLSKYDEWYDIIELDVLGFLMSKAFNTVVNNDKDK